MTVTICHYCQTPIEPAAVRLGSDGEYYHGECWSKRQRARV